MASHDLRYLRVKAHVVVVNVPNVKPLPGEPVSFSYAAHGGREKAIQEGTDAARCVTCPRRSTLAIARRYTNCLRHS